MMQLKRINRHPEARAGDRVNDAERGSASCDRNMTPTPMLQPVQ